MSVKESLEKTKSKIEGMTDSETKRILLARANEHLAKYDGSDQIVSSHEVWEEIKDLPVLKPMKTGHDKLDEIIKGFYPKQCIYLGAPTASGKTSFTLDLIDRMKQYNPLFLSFEQTVEELLSTMKERGQDIPHFVTPRRKRMETISWISDRITESVLKNDTKVVFIDHFGYIKNEGKFWSETNQITDTLMELEQIADELDIAIVTIVHINKNDPVEIPSKKDLKGSAGFDHQADTIIMLWREAFLDKKEVKWSNKVLVSVQKNRKHGTNANFRMKYENYKFIQDDSITFNYEDGGGYGSYDEN